MEKIFMNTLNSKANESNRFIYQFTDNLNLKNPNKNVALANLSVYYKWKNIKSECNSNKIKISEYVFKKHETIADNPPVQIYMNKRKKNRIVFSTKTGYKIELLSEETMQLLGSSKKDIDQNKDGEIVPILETAEVALVHCNLVNSSYQQAFKVLFTFVPNKQFRQLITVTPHSPRMLKKTNAGFSFIEIWFTDQNSRPLEIEDNVNITLIIGTA